MAHSRPVLPRILAAQLPSSDARSTPGPGVRVCVCRVCECRDRIEVGKALVKCFEVEEFVDVRINAVRLVAKKALRGDPHVVDGLLMLVRRDRSSQVE